MTAQQIVDALEAGTLVIPADYREILQALATVINSASGGGEISGTPSTIPIFNVSGDGIEDSGISYNGTGGLEVVGLNGQSVIFAQASQDGSIAFGFGNDVSGINLNSTDGDIEITSSSGGSSLHISNGTADSYTELSVAADDTDTHFELVQATATIFRADATGISTDGTNFLKIVTNAVGAPTPDSKIEVILNGNTYYIAAELVP